MHARREETARSWAAYFAEVGAKYHWLNDIPFLAEDKLETAAKAVAHVQFLEYQRLYGVHLSDEEYPEWEAVFVEVYKDAYITQEKVYIDNEGNCEPR